MQCQRCVGEQFVKAGRDRAGRQIYPCATCDRRQTDRSLSAFRGYRFPDDVIALSVRWYLHFRLPSADLVELLAERGVHVDAATVFDWVQRFTPLYQEAARSHRHRVGVRWAVDETYLRRAGRWVYSYRATDEHGHVIDVYLSETRNTAYPVHPGMRWISTARGNLALTFTGELPPLPLRITAHNTLVGYQQESGHLLAVITSGTPIDYTTTRMSRGQIVHVHVTGTIAIRSSFDLSQKRLYAASERADLTYVVTASNKLDSHLRLLTGRTHVIDAGLLQEMPTSSR